MPQRPVMMQPRQSSMPHSRHIGMSHYRQSNVSPQSRKTSSPQTMRPSRASIPILSGIHLNFCQTATLALLANIRLIGSKYPRKPSRPERIGLAQYVSSLIANFPCDRERELMNEAVNEMPLMYSDRRAFNRWADFFGKRILKGTNSPVKLNFGNVLVPAKGHKNNRKTAMSKKY